MKRAFVIVMIIGCGGWFAYTAILRDRALPLANLDAQMTGHGAIVADSARVTGETLVLRSPYVVASVADIGARPCTVVVSTIPLPVAKGGATGLKLQMPSTIHIYRLLPGGSIQPDGQETIAGVQVESELDP